MGRIHSLIPIAIACILLAGAGCGGDDAEPVERTPETLDRPAQLPPAWGKAINRSAGFSIGVPPGWTARHRGTRTVLRSADGLVAASVAADRTGEALALPLQQYAAQAAKALGEEHFEGLRVGEPERREGRYPGAVVEASGTQRETDVKQQIEVIVLRRPEVSVFPILIARSGTQDPKLYWRELARIVSSLRGHPPELGP